MALDDHHDTPDEALLIAFGNGDAGAARLLTARLLPRVLAIASRLLTGDRAEAEDVAQEAMLRLWRIAPDWRSGEAKVTTWLYRVTSNLCIDRIRRRGRSVALEAAGDPPDPHPGAAAALLAADRSAALDAALARLPDRQRQAVVLRHLEELANPQIAEIMEISTEAVESLTARGRRALAAALTARREELGYDAE
ncbi:RNA polymerase sigma factor [Mesobaculum littorinae]|uniref:RNA polymerase sigma factor n=2 Tax=Mesobaculum littorinae TaxID=2486419 RepID=A0A438AJ62_9RHOB|nr:RNA polymerase sigma factor [Mesobaculum littorinae]RVV98803.1 RNA polymerase sigma factor [Mesobaculum littorinae]